MLVLGIESTCDETAAAVVRDGREILSNIVASQADLHEVYGGVVPELACRRHVDLAIPVVDQALKEASVSLDEIDCIAVARGPGLIGALLVGINTAKALALATGKPLVGINHIESHLYAALMSADEPPVFPCLGVVISGGHTALVVMESIGEYCLIGQTVDDAIGEAFDKVAKILGLPYPGGPQVERLAQGGDPSHFALKGGRVKGAPYNFSFSGLKTGVLYAAKGQSAKVRDPLILKPEEQKHLAAAFQDAAFGDLTKKIGKASLEFGLDTAVFGGGVANNRTLRDRIAQHCPEMRLLWPAPELTMDNAAMIAGLGYHAYETRGSDGLTFEAMTRIPLGQ